MGHCGSASPSQPHTVVGALVFISAGILYIATLAPGYVWGDSTKLIFYVLEHKFTGLEFGTHQLYILLGYFFSFLPVSLAYSQNLLSAFFAAGAVYLSFCIVLNTTGDIRAGLAASASIAVSHLFWLYGIINETYSLLAFFTLLGLFLCLKWVSSPQDWHLYALGAVIGAGLSNHALLLLAVPGFLVLLWGNRFASFSLSWKGGLVILAFLFGSSQILLIPIIEAGSIQSFISQLASHTSDIYQTYSKTPLEFVRELSAYPLYLLYQFPSPAIVLGGIGFAVGLQHSRRLVISSALTALPLLLFATQFMRERQFAMLIPTFNIFALWVGLGTAYLLEKRPLYGKPAFLIALLVSLLIFPPTVYYTASKVAEAIHYDVSFVRALPYRNPYSYYLFPPKNAESGPQRYVADAFRQAKPNAIILADFVPGMVLLYAQRVLHHRMDLEIDIFIDVWVRYSSDPSGAILDFLRTQVILGQRTVYLADDWNAYYHASEIRKEFKLERDKGPLWQVTPLIPTGNMR